MVYDVFISYRRDGGYETAKHINDLLVRDGYTVSFDIDTLREGDFDKALLKRVEECVDFLLIVDKHCFDKTISGSCKPDQDWLRQEVAYALKLKKNIVTLLLAGASFPDNLPSDISEVAKKNGPIYSKGYFDTFYERLKNVFLHSHPRNSEKKESGIGDTRSAACLKLKTDFECLFCLDGEEKLHLKPGEIQKIPLPEGEYELKFVRVDNGDVLFTEDFVMSAVDKLYKLKWVDVVLSGLDELENPVTDLPMPPKPQSKKAEQESLERERSEAERKAKEAAERERKAEEDRRKAEEEAERARLEKERIEREEAERKANFIIDGHEYVDLGLPSGTLWATCNVGASKPEDYGDYFSWDESEKAAAKWGDGWCMPTKEQFDELLSNTKHTWTTRNGVYGKLFMAKNGNSLFLPAAGCRFGSSLNHAGSNGNYWSSSLYTGHPGRAFNFGFGSGYIYLTDYNCKYGHSVRAVREN